MVCTQSNRFGRSLIKHLCGVTKKSILSLLISTSLVSFTFAEEANYTGDANNDNNWTNADNWDTTEYPEGGDSVTIGRFIVNLDQGISGLQLLDIGNSGQEGTILLGTETLSVSGTSDIGKLSLTGAGTLSTQSTLAASAFISLNGWTWDVNGTTLLENSTVNFDGGNLNNNSTMTLTGTNQFIGVSQGNGGTFKNNGTITKMTGDLADGLASIGSSGLSFENNAGGTVHATVNEIKFVDNFTNNNGTLQASGTGSISIGNTASSSSTINGGTFNVNDNRKIAFNSGIHTFSGNMTTSGTGEIVINSGAIIDGGFTMQAQANAPFILNGGVINGHFNAVSNFRWQNGTMNDMTNNSLDMRIEAPTAGSVVKRLIAHNALVANNNTITQTALLTLDERSTLLNREGAIYVLKDGAGINSQSTDDYGSVVNLGSMQVVSANPAFTPTSTINPEFKSRGNLSIQNSILDLQNLAEIEGNINITQNLNVARLRINQILSNDFFASSLGGSIQFHSNAGVANNSATVDIFAAKLKLSSITSSGNGQIRHLAGIVSVEQNINISTPNTAPYVINHNPNVSDNHFALIGDATSTATLIFEHGRIVDQPPRGSGRLINAGPDFVIQGVNSKIIGDNNSPSGGTILNTGTINHRGTSSTNLVLQAGGKIINQASGEYLIHNGGNILNGLTMASTEKQFINIGIIKRVGDSAFGTSTISTNIENTDTGEIISELGKINITGFYYSTDGTLNTASANTEIKLSGGGTISGGKLKSDVNSKIIFASGNYIINGTLAGTSDSGNVGGIAEFNGGNLTIEGSPGAGGTLSFSEASPLHIIAGQFGGGLSAQNADGIKWQGGTLFGENGFTVNGGTLTLETAGSKILSDGTSGKLDVAAGKINHTRGALVFDNNAQLNIADGATYELNDSGTGFQKRNAGVTNTQITLNGDLVRETGTGTLNVNIPVESEGNIISKSGTLQFNEMLVHKGTLSATGLHSAVTINGGGEIENTSIELENNGEVRIQNEVVELKSSIDVSGTGKFRIVSNGTLKVLSASESSTTEVNINHANGVSYEGDAQFVLENGGTIDAEKTLYIEGGPFVWKGGLIKGASGMYIRYSPTNESIFDGFTLNLSDGTAGDIQNNGIIKHDNGTINFNTNAQIKNNGKYIIEDNSVQFNKVSGATNVLFDNSSGTFEVKKNTTVNIPFLNPGLGSFPGKVEVSNSTLTFNDVVNVDNQELSGIWELDNGRTVFNGNFEFTSIHGRVRLSGSGAVMGGISNVEVIRGSLLLFGDSSAATSKDLFLAGKLVVAPGSSFSAPNLFIVNNGDLTANSNLNIAGVINTSQAENNIIGGGSEETPPTLLDFQGNVTASELNLVDHTLFAENNTFNIPTIHINAAQANFAHGNTLNLPVNHPSSGVLNVTNSNVQLQFTNPDASILTANDTFDMTFDADTNLEILTDFSNLISTTSAGMPMLKDFNQIDLAGDLIISMIDLPEGNSRPAHFIPGDMVTLATFATRIGTFDEIINNTNLPGLDFEIDYDDAMGEITLSASAFLDGDANLDGTVNIQDLALLASSFNQTGTLWTNGDFNGDGMVNIQDLATLASTFNQTIFALPISSQSVQTNPIPEPGSILLLLSGVTLCDRRRRRIS